MSSVSEIPVLGSVEVPDLIWPDAVVPVVIPTIGLVDMQMIFIDMQIICIWM